MTVAASLRPLGGDAFERAVLNKMARDLNRVLRRAAPRIRERLGEAVGDRIQDEPEARSLHGGSLQGELGVTNPDAAIHAAIAAITRAMQVDVVPVKVAGSRITGGLKIGVLRIDFAELQSVMDQAAFRSEGRYTIDWLRWLLTEGDVVIIGDYHFQGGDFDRSRTGLGLMFQGGTWRVPQEFSGTINDNWFTRSLRGLEIPLSQIVNEELRRATT